MVLAITRFVKDVSIAGGSRFVPPAERIEVFDNNGTLWAEQPTYVQLAFALDRGKTLAPMLSEWKQSQPFKAVLDDDLKTLLTGGSGARFSGLVHYPAADREWAYDRSPFLGRLDKALDEAKAKSWTVVDMRRDWKLIFPFE